MIVDQYDFGAATTSAEHLRLNKYFQLAAIVILLYDHAITFSEEVERIWSKRVTGVTVLFCLNRYLSPLLMSVDLAAYHDPRFMGNICTRFVKFEGFAAVAIIAVCEMTMILRVVAFYNRSLFIFVLLITLWCAQVSISIAGFLGGFAAQWPRPDFIGCVFVGDGPLFASLWIACLITNTIMFLLTFCRSGDIRLPGRRTPILRVFMRDGAMYFAVIFCANAINALIYFLASPDLNALSAPLTLLITSVMVSRLVLNLRSASTSRFTSSYWNGRQTLPFSFLDRTFGNIGEEFEPHSDASIDVQMDELCEGNKGTNTV